MEIRLTGTTTSLKARSDFFFLFPKVKLLRPLNVWPKQEGKGGKYQPRASWEEKETATKAQLEANLDSYAQEGFAQAGSEGLFF